MELIYSHLLSAAASEMPSSWILFWPAAKKYLPSAQDKETLFYISNDSDLYRYDLFVKNTSQPDFTGDPTFANT